jgi:hypothetical protein
VPICLLGESSSNPPRFDNESHAISAAAIAQNEAKAEQTTIREKDAPTETG